MNQSEHAQAMTDRFRELVEAAGDKLPDGHYDELRLIIESGLDAALIEQLDNVATQLEALAKQIKRSAESGV